MTPWKIAAVQMDCRFGDKTYNLERIRSGLREAARQGARLVIFPECALTGYAFESAEEAEPHAELVPGPATETLASECARLDAWAVVGLLERTNQPRALFNSCVLVGPSGLVVSYRKIHLPFLGVDRFTLPATGPS